MKTLKEYINEASLLDIKGTMDEGDEMQKKYELAESEFKKHVKGISIDENGKKFTKSYITSLIKIDEPEFGRGY